MHLTTVVASAKLLIRMHVRNPHSYVETKLIHMRQLPHMKYVILIYLFGRKRIYVCVCLIECIRIAHFPWITVLFLSNSPIDCRKCNKTEIKSYIFYFPLSSNYFRINFLLIYCAEIRCFRNKMATPWTAYDTRQTLSAIKTTCIWAKRSEFSIHTRSGRKNRE